jgi:hypothetical protein
MSAAMATALAHAETVVKRFHEKHRVIEKLFDNIATRVIIFWLVSHPPNYEIL